MKPEHKALIAYASDPANFKMFAAGDIEWRDGPEARPFLPVSIKEAKALGQGHYETEEQMGRTHSYLRDCADQAWRDGNGAQRFIPISPREATAGVERIRRAARLVHRLRRGVARLIWRLRRPRLQRGIT